MGRYFWDDPRKPPIGLNANIERHRAAKASLQAKLAEAEAGTDAMSQAAARTYRQCLLTLEADLAELVSKLGRSLATKDAG